MNYSNIKMLEIFCIRNGLYLSKKLLTVYIKKSRLPKEGTV